MSNKFKLSFIFVVVCGQRKMNQVACQCGNCDDFHTASYRRCVERSSGWGRSFASVVAVVAAKRPWQWRCRYPAGVLCFHEGNWGRRWHGFWSALKRQRNFKPSGSWSWSTFTKDQNGKKKLSKTSTTDYLETLILKMCEELTREVIYESTLHFSWVIYKQVWLSSRGGQIRSFIKMSLRSFSKFWW